MTTSRKHSVALQVAFVAGLLTTGLGNAAEVEIFGNLHLSFDSVEGSNDDDRQESIASNQSIFAFRGTQEISEDLEVRWQVAQIVDLDEASDKFNWANFNSGVGLHGKWGTIFGGRHDMPFKFFLFPMFRGEGTGPFIIRHLGDVMTIMGTGVFRPTPNGAVPFSVPYNLRASNAVMYTSPAILDNLRIRAAYSTELDLSMVPKLPPQIASLEEANSAEEDLPVYSTDISYTDGPLFLGIAYEEHDFDKSNGWRIGGAYRIDMTKIGGFYETLNGDPVLSPDLDRDAWTAWLSQGFGENSVKLFYSKAESYDGSDDTGANLWTLQVTHNLAFTTQIYALYSELDNEDKSNRGLGFWGHGVKYAADFGEDLSGFSVGILHRF